MPVIKGVLDFDRRGFHRQHIKLPLESLIEPATAKRLVELDVTTAGNLIDFQRSSNGLYLSRDSPYL